MKRLMILVVMTLSVVSSSSVFATTKESTNKLPISKKEVTYRDLLTEDDKSRGFEIESKVNYRSIDVSTNKIEGLETFTYLVNNDASGFEIMFVDPNGIEYDIDMVDYRRQLKVVKDHDLSVKLEPKVVVTDVKFADIRGEKLVKNSIKKNLCVSVKVELSDKSKSQFDKQLKESLLLKDAKTILEVE